MHTQCNLHPFPFYLQYWEHSASCRPVILSFAALRHLPVFFHYQQSRTWNRLLPLTSALIPSRRQANIVPAIATNHTVTIAAELVSMTSLCVLSVPTCSSRRRMEHISSGNVKYPIQLHDPFHWRARMNTCRRSVLTLSHRL